MSKRKLCVRLGTWTVLVHKHLFNHNVSYLAAEKSCYDAFPSHDASKHSSEMARRRVACLEGMAEALHHFADVHAETVDVPFVREYTYKRCYKRHAKDEDTASACVDGVIYALNAIKEQMAQAGIVGKGMGRLVRMGGRLARRERR